MFGYGIDGTEDYMADACFWINRMADPDDEVLDREGIEKFNTLICEKVDGVYDLQSYGDFLSGRKLRKFISFYRVPERVMYDKCGREIPESFFEGAARNANLDGIREKNPVRYGIAVADIAFRSFPVDDGAFNTPGDREFDRLRQTGCTALEPVAVLHESRDRKWYFVQRYNYRGWTRKEGVAIAEDKSQVFDFVNAPEFLVALGKHVHTQYNPYECRASSLRFTMGARIPLQMDAPESVGGQSSAGSYPVRLAVRDGDGMLGFTDALIAATEDVHVGYLKYTAANVLRQVFKFLGDRYGWGDGFGGTDCSGTILNVYRTVGFLLPRNADKQECVPGIKYSFGSCATMEERDMLLLNGRPGAAIFMPGHVMMYLGCVEGQPFMIHDFHQYGRKSGDSYEAVPVNEVAVTSAHLPMVSGKPFIDAFTSLVRFE